MKRKDEAGPGGTGSPDSLLVRLDEQIDRAAALMKLDPDIRRIFARMENEIEIHFPVRMDDGRIQMFTGYRMQHSNVLGAFKGGIRFDPSEDVDAARALSTWTTLRHAFLNLPFGGAVGGIRCDPGDYSAGELERITRRFTFSLGSNIGPEYDVLGPDVGTDAQIMAWILDTYLSTMPANHRHGCRHVVTGKPIPLGGCPGHDRAGALGIVNLVEEWARQRSVPIEDLTYSLQGTGSTPLRAARLLKSHGARLVAVQDSGGCVRDPDGIDADNLAEHVQARGTVGGFERAEAFGRKAFFSVRAQALIAADPAEPLGLERAPLLRVRLLVDCSEGNFLPERDAQLRGHGVEVIPDILSGAGGPILQYFEWLQNRRSEYWDEDETSLRLREWVLTAYGQAQATAAEYQVDLRTAALILALTRLADVYLKRGIFP